MVGTNYLSDRAATTCIQTVKETIQDHFFKSDQTYGILQELINLTGRK